MTKISQKFYEKIETRKRCKGVHCVDLGESFPTHIYLQNLASIQPRTSLLKFEGGGFSAPVIPRLMSCRVRVGLNRGSIVEERILNIGPHSKYQRSVVTSGLRMMF